MLLLHHINLGFPVVAPESELLLPPGTATTPDEPTWRRGAAPGAPTQVFVHRLPADAAGRAHLALVNRAFDGGRGIGVAISFTRDAFPLLWQWRNLQPGEYVMGLEPSNAQVGGRRATREAGTLRVLAPGETATFGSVITALRDGDAIAAVAARLAGTD